MPENNPRLPKRSWRYNQPTGATPKQGRRAWQKEPGQASSGPWLTRRAKLALAAAAFVVVMVVWIVVALWPHPVKPFRLVLIGVGYETNLAVPANAFGRRGLADFARWADDNSEHFAGRKDQGIDVRNEVLETGADAFAESLKDCRSPTVFTTNERAEVSRRNTFGRSAYDQLAMSL